MRPAPPRRTSNRPPRRSACAPIGCAARWTISSPRSAPLSACSGEVPSTHVAARIVGLAVAPLAHQLAQRVVLPLGEHDAHRGQQVAGLALGGKTLALEAEGAPAAGAGRDRELDRP